MIWLKGQWHEREGTKCLTRQCTIQSLPPIKCAWILMTSQTLFERPSIQSYFWKYAMLHTLQKEPPILCEETEFIFCGNDFSRRPRYAIELRVLRGARTRVPVPRTRVSYWEQLNNLTLRNWRDDHLSWSYKPSGTFIPVLVIHSHRNEIDSSPFSVGWLHHTRGGKTRICSTLSFHFPDQKINYELWVMSTSSRKSCLIEMQYVNWSCLHFVDTDWLHLRSKQMKENRNPEITKFFKICGDCFVKSFIIRLKICQAF